MTDGRGLQAREDGVDEPGKPTTTRPKQLEDRESEGFAAPLGSSKKGRLRLASGAHRLSIRADPDARGLYRARFGNQTPIVEVRGGEVTIRHPPLSAREWLDDRSERSAEVALNATIPWDIEVRGGVSRLVADLRELSLGSLGLEGGAGRVEVALPVPSGTVSVAVLGGASNVSIHIPEGTPARLRVSGGVTNLTFGDRHIGAAGGDVDLRSREYEAATGRYDVIVTGGANNLRVREQRARGRDTEMGPGQTR